MVKTMYINIFHSVYTAVLAYELRHLRAAIHNTHIHWHTAVMLTRPHYEAEVTY